MPSSPHPHVLFVCTGNTCRSPMAEGLLRAACGDDLEVSSAGVAAMPGGQASAKTLRVLKQRNVSLDNFGSRQVEDSIIENASLIIAMGSSHSDMLRSCYPERSHDIHLLCDFIDESEGVKGADVPDPFGMNQSAYDEVAKVIEAAIPGIIKFTQS